MRGIRWLLMMVLVAWCVPLLGCGSKDSGGPASPPSQPAPKDSTKDKK
jgi:hypothetical protein